MKFRFFIFPLERLVQMPPGSSFRHSYRVAVHWRLRNERTLCKLLFKQVSLSELQSSKPCMLNNCQKIFDVDLKGVAKFWSNLQN